ncbi:hypothetical protein [Sunxiuqinia sp. sy24]|uniref:hypothetical protein n=1 Tax=Sunxiuqinia sp. sy24 TaxID=3461495 RepID=UPI00404671D3
MYTSIFSHQPSRGYELLAFPHSKHTRYRSAYFHTWLVFSKILLCYSNVYSAYFNTEDTQKQRRRYPEDPALTRIKPDQITSYTYSTEGQYEYTNSSAVPLSTDTNLSERPEPLPDGSEPGAEGVEEKNAGDVGKGIATSTENLDGALRSCLLMHLPNISRK